MSHEAARRAILGTLRDSVIGRINFRVGTVPVTPRLYARIAALVREGTIHVKHVPGLVSSAIYNSTENRFYMRSDTITRMTQGAIIVHEATHAGCDLMNASQMRVVSSEAAAYLAQCVFARAKTRNPQDERLESESETMDAIFESAWELAGVVLAGRQPTEAQIEGLRGKILAHPDYAQGRNLAGYDGIRAPRT